MTWGFEEIGDLGRSQDMADADADPNDTTGEYDLGMNFQLCETERDQDGNPLPNLRNL